MSRRLVAAIAIAALAFGACSRGGTRTRENDTLVIAQQREPMSLNPALENGLSAAQWGLLLFQYLVKLDDRGRLVGDAAADVPTTRNGGISRDGRTIVYHLRPGLRFADGSPLTARDCVWSIAAILNPANDVQTRYGYDRIVRADAPDARTLVLHLRRPFAPLIALVLAPQGFPIFPAHLLARYPDFNHLAFDAAPVGSGPYVVTRWTRGDSVEMRSNPYYWRGRPAIARLVVRFVPDPNTAIDLLRTGEIDGFFGDEDLSNYPVLRGLAGVTVRSAPIDGVGAILFNTADPLTADPRVRHALAEAIDIPALVAKAYHGALDATGAGRGLFLWAYDPRVYPDIPYDPAAARALLDAAGWKLGPDGIRRKNGRTLDLLFIIQAATPGDAIVGNVVAFDERRVGARVALKAFNETQFVSPANLGGPVYGGKFQMALYPFLNGDDPDTTDQFACDRVAPHGYNKTRICDPRIDALLAGGRETYDIAARKALYAALQGRLYRALPLALLYQRREVDAFDSRLRGLSISPSGGYWNAGAWHLAP